MRLQPKLRNALLEQRGHLLLWVPCFFGLGISLYFGNANEPGAGLYGLAGAVMVLGVFMMRIWPDEISPLAAGIALIAAGFIWAGYNAHRAAAPVLDRFYYGMIEGRILKIDQSSSGLPRVTIDELRLPNMRGGAAPERITLSLAELSGPIEPGWRLRTIGSLSPPSWPAEPHGFDYQRYAWFKRLGATGYSRKPVTIFMPQTPLPVALRMSRVRQSLAQSIVERIDGRAGPVAAAIVTGDRRLIDKGATESLRASNLSHLLAISGLHMGLLCGLVFLCCRFVLAFSKRQISPKKISAAAAITAGLIYLFLSGGSVATERAFIMASVFFLAVFLDRRALTLRAVALAAVIVLLRRPEALISPGFQMSFAATSALVVVAGALSAKFWRWPAVSVLVSSFIAGVATAPFAAAHFNITASYGLLANLLSVPVMASVVMPATLAAGLLAPIGLAAPALWVMGAGLEWILRVAETISSWPGAVHGVPSAPRAALPLITLGALWGMAWQGPAKGAGGVAIIAGLLVWIGAERPDLLISAKGGLAGVLTNSGRSLSNGNADTFVARVWLQNDGEFSDVSTVQQRAGWLENGPLRTTYVGPNKIVVAKGKKAIAALAQCDGADILITDQWRQEQRQCRVIGPETLAKSGSIAIYQDGSMYREITARDVIGRRLWNERSKRQ